MRVGYIGLLILEKRNWLEDNFMNWPIHENVHFHHCTVAYEPSAEKIEQYKPNLGHVYELKVNGFVLTNEIAVLTIDDVEGLPVENRYPHITVSCATGIKPFYSNQVLEKFTPVDISEEKFVLHGVLYLHEWKEVRTEPPDASERFPKQGSA